MQFRLWHILALMALILLAGVLSIQQLEAHVGRTTVPGIVIVDVPDLDPSAAEAVVRRWPGALLQWAPADEAPLAPFGPAALGTLRSRGYASALLRPREAAPVGGGDAPDAEPGAAVGASAITPAMAAVIPSGRDDPDEALHQAWGVLLSDQDTRQAATSLADFVRTCDGVRPFIIGLQLESPTVAELVSAVALQVDAAESLPAFRRTTVLVLGAREPQSQRRVVVRVDRGDMDRFPPPALKDLLAATR